MSKWDERFLELAETVASWSKDPSTRVGCVITRPDNTVASLGYNGFPRGCDDDDSLLANRDTKIARTIHAELNAVLNSRERLDDCTAFVTHPPCSSCAGSLIQSGIKEVIWRRPSPDILTRWRESIEMASVMFFEAGVYYREF